MQLVTVYNVPLAKSHGQVIFKIICLHVILILSNTLTPHYWLQVWCLQLYFDETRIALKVSDY